MKLETDSYKRIIENLHDGLYFVDRDRTITFWNNAAEQISGFSADEVIGRPCYENILTHVDDGGNTLCMGMCPLAETISDGENRSAIVYMHHRNGHRIPVSVRVSTLTDKAGNIIGGIELFTDISNLEANELRVKELEKLAFLDHLTQLANRHYVEREIQNRFEEKKRYNMPFGILFMDIDYFKRFNDTHGHDVGDKMLRLISKTLVSNSRPFDIYGRWGGEEFLGIIKNSDAVELELLGNRIRRLVENSYIIHNGEKLNATISIGAAVVREDDDIDSLLKRADSLLYKSKDAGRNCMSIDSGLMPWDA